MSKPCVLLVTFLSCLFTATISHAEDKSGSIFESRVHEGHLCARGSTWLSVRNMTVKISSQQLQKSASYDMKIHDNHDMQLVVHDSSLTGNQLSGEAMLIAGRALVTRDINIQENYAIDVLDNAVSFQQLVFTLLGLAAVEGPNKTTFPAVKEMSEGKYPIKTTTQSMSAMFNAPWKSVIDLRKRKDGSIVYKIAFTCILQTGTEATFHLEGFLSNYGESNMNEAIPDNFTIEGWKQYNIGPYTKKVERGTIYDFGTTLIEAPYASLGELRRHIEQKRGQ